MRVWVALAALACSHHPSDPAPPAPAPVNAGVLPVAAAPDAGDPRTLNEQGDELEQKGAHAGAVARYEQAVALDPGFGLAWGNLGWARMAAGDLVGAVKANERALALSGGNAQLAASAHYNLGRVAEKRGDVETAKHEYRESLRLRPHKSVAARLTSLDSAAEKTADAPLLADEPLDDAPRPIAAATLDDAIVAFGAKGVAIARAGDVALVPAAGGLIVVGKSGDRWAALPLKGATTGKLRGLGGNPGEDADLVVETDAGTWLLGDGLGVRLALPAGCRVTRPTDGEIEVTGESIDAGRYRLVDGAYRKLEL